MDKNAVETQSGPGEQGDEGLTWSMVFKFVVLIVTMGLVLTGANFGCTYATATQHRIEQQGFVCKQMGMIPAEPVMQLPETAIHMDPPAPAAEL